jgi:hypothetical protein
MNWDYAQRMESPLPPRLRAKLRWMTAHVNRCDYAKAYARADFLRVGGQAEQMDKLLEEMDKLPEVERLSLQLIRQLAEAGYTVTDAQINRLVELCGEEEVVAMVLLAAFANMQDRLLLALGVSVDPSGPLPPIKLQLRKEPTVPQVASLGKDVQADQQKARPKRRASPPSANPPPVPERLEDPEWTAISFDTLRELVKQQIVRRQARIRVPDAKAVIGRLPPELPQPDKQLRIVWHLVTYGYEPKLTAAWSAAGRGFREDADLDRIHANSMFWVVTRSVQCFY